MSAAAFTPAIIPPAPAHLAPSRQRDIIHSGELAIANGLRLIGRGVFATPERDGAPLFVVNSASRAGLVHLVWVERGRIMCDCEARTQRQAFTCSHAQFVRMLIVAERATPASVPPAARAEPAPAPAPAPAVAPAPEPARRVPCPSCGAPTDSAEVEQLGECLCCLQTRADMERAAVAEERAREEWAHSEEERAARLPCWACGAPATAETDHGLYCDLCVKYSPPALALAVQARQRFIAAGYIRDESAAQTIRRAPKPTKPSRPAKAETARRVVARETARERAGIPSAASARARRSIPAD